jgi:hypothetical protein
MEKMGKYESASLMERKRMMEKAERDEEAREALNRSRETRTRKVRISKNMGTMAVILTSTLAYSPPPTLM